MSAISSVALNRVLVADLEILGASFFFGVGFIGQRAVSVDGLGPLTCNAMRFGLSAVFLGALLLLLPPRYLAVLNGEEEREKQKREDALYKDKDSNEESDSESVRLLRHAGDAAAASVSSGVIGLHDNRHLTPVKDKDRDREDSDSPQSPLARCCHSLRSLCLSSLISCAGGEEQAARHWLSARNSILFWAVFLGSINFMGSGLQQIGISYTSASKVAFIAGFDLFLTPLFAMCLPGLPPHTPPPPSTWLSIFGSLIGLFLLSDASLTEMDLGFGECVTLVSTLFWTMHITYTDLATNCVRTLEMICVQMVCVSVLSLMVAFYVEDVSAAVHHLLLYLPWLLFLAVVEAMGFFLMALGQTHAPPTHAALILSLEGVFAAAAAFLVLGESLSFGELCGCAIMLAATLMAELGVPALDNPKPSALQLSGSGRNHINAWFDLESVSASVSAGSVGEKGGSSVWRTLRDSLARAWLYVQRISGTRVNQA